MPRGEIGCGASHLPNPRAKQTSPTQTLHVHSPFFTASPLQSLSLVSQRPTLLLQQHRYTQASQQPDAVLVKVILTQ